MIGLRLRQSAALATFVMASVLASPVLAHAALESATPGPGDRVIGSPTELVARFTQDLDPSRTSLEVRDAAGNRIARGGELGDGPREFRLDLPELKPGLYEVRWTTFSTEDSEIFRDSYTFEVVAPTPTSTTAPTPPPPSTTASASPQTSPRSETPSSSLGPSPTSGPATGGPAIDAVLLLPIIVAALLVGVLGVWMIRRPRG